jgi:hypothetical protein
VEREAERPPAAAQVAVRAGRERAQVRGEAVAPAARLFQLARDGDGGEQLELVRGASERKLPRDLEGVVADAGLRRGERDAVDADSH